ncbi:hypothetical protein BY996DRAFT_4644300 [Phakopsora pachyrhizi]|uniref:Expressed protein n=1 Tax=Phakopsora pachyrhizi TaxID=170000 RepID=A0AAV0BXI2_PHAPC|nr:hypothetical protein BY996DRAFT_4644300 [Phakopsora pachyrhizi]CAH7690894.1 expressed protein [Phakopsora pachyrhizi]
MSTRINTRLALIRYNGRSRCYYSQHQSNHSLVTSPSRSLSSVPLSKADDRVSIYSHLKNSGDTIRLLESSRNLLDSIRLNPNSDAWSQPELVKRQKTYQPLRQAIEEWDQYESLVDDLKLISETDPDKEMRRIAEAELETLTSTQLPRQVQIIRNELIQAHSPTPRSFQLSSALLEIKPGVGGVEASHFSTTLMNMYTRFAQRQNWTLKPISIEYMVSGQGQDGLREAVLEIEGKNVYRWLRWEAGVHRVQRVPVMQNTSSIHTSTAAVIVLPLNSKTQDSDTEEEELFDEKDIRLDTMRSQGAGGQHVNKTESAVRLTHLPTGIVVSMQDSRSQHQNRARAFMILRARLWDLKSRQRKEDMRGLRLSQVKNTQRSEKIRTYNYPQGRVTDHRAGLTIPRLTNFLEDGGSTKKDQPNDDEIQFINDDSYSSVRSSSLEMIWQELERLERRDKLNEILDEFSKR